MSKRIHTTNIVTIVGAVLLALALVFAAAAIASAQTWSTPAFNVAKPADARTFTAPAPGEFGAVFLEWTPAAIPSNPEKPRLIFNHLFRHAGGGELLVRTHYDAYNGPSVLELVVGWVRVIRSRPIALQRGRTYRILAWWRPVGRDRTEYGLALDGRYLAVVTGPRLKRPNRPVTILVGARGPRPVEDPDFPGVQHADGRIRAIYWLNS